MTPTVEAAPSGAASGTSGRAAPRRTTRLWVALAAGAACAMSLSGCALLDGAAASPDPSASAAASAGRPTTPVVRGDLVDGKKFPGTLGYGPATPLRSAAGGTVTGLPAVGDVIGLDGVLYSVDEKPVRALHGTVPLWRTLEQGLRGADVGQLKDSLRALGYDVADDDVFDGRTRAAVVRWQKDRGLERTGTLTASDVAFVPGDVRVGELEGRVGDAAGEVLWGWTPASLVASASVSAADAARFPGGAAVQVGLPSGTTVPGTVQGVDDASSDDGGGKGGGGGAGGGEKKTVVVRLDAPLPEGTSTTAAVDLLVDGEKREGVLSVPVTALLASADGYAVEKQVGGTVERVPVELGFFAQGRVEVVGGELAEGDEVVVPS